MRWIRIALISGLLAGAVSAALGLSLWLSKPPDRTPPPFPSRVATDAEQRDILEALIESSDPRPDISSPALIEDGIRFCAGEKVSLSSAHTCFRPGSVENAIESPRFNPDLDAVPEIALDFRRALIRANLREHRMPCPEGEIVFIAASEAAVLAVNDRQSDGFYKRYPDLSGTLRATRAVVSKDGRQALIYSEKKFGGSAGFLHRFERDNGQWRLESTYGIWMS